VQLSAFEALDALEQTCLRIIHLGPREAEQADLDVQPGVGRFAHVHLDRPESLDGAHKCGEPHLGCDVGDLGSLVAVEGHEIGSDDREESLA
jgi:hypothetical protein